MKLHGHFSKVIEYFKMVTDHKTEHNHDAGPRCVECRPSGVKDSSSETCTEAMQ